MSRKIKLSLGTMVPEGFEIIADTPAAKGFDPRAEARDLYKLISSAIPGSTVDALFEILSRRAQRLEDDRTLADFIESLDD